MISSTSRRVTSCVASPIVSALCALMRSISSLSSISRSRRKTAFSKSLSEIAFFISLTIGRVSISSLRRFCVSATRLQLHLRAGLVEDVDGLVREEAVGDVAVRLVHRRLDRLGRVPDLVELLVPLLDPLEDLEASRPRSAAVTLDRLEAAQEGAVLLDVLAVLPDRRRADARDLAARERRLQDVRRVERALGGAGPDQRVDLVDEDDDVRVLVQLADDSLESLLELAAVLRAGDDQREVEREDLCSRKEHRDLAVDDARSRALRRSPSCRRPARRGGSGCSSCGARGSG